MIRRLIKKLPNSYKACLKESVACSTSTSLLNVIFHSSSIRIHNHILYYFLQEGKSEYLEGLLEATKELSHIDRSNIFYHLLVTYCKADETDKALGLWTILQEEGEIPSDQFLSYLGNHLKSKKREVPFIIPQYTAKPVKKPSKMPAVPKAETADKPTVTENSTTQDIEQFVQKGDLEKALNVAVKSIENGVMPKSKVLKFMLKKLAEQGEVEKIQLIGKYFNDNMRRNVTYDDKLTLAIFKSGAGSQHVDSLLEAVNTANTDEDLEAALIKFPRSNALASIMNNNELLAKCKYNILLYKT